ncbi:MAG: glycosyl transferase, group 1 [Candidatus Saccharibacteria bacterium]|nr:glycosyl transferase, group 1 [Candidatus Saccharibacteria bacterium]
MHIAIDARIINSTSGRYTERLVTYLQDIDKTNQYTILVRAKDENFWKPRNKNFTVMVAEFDQFSFAEQLGFNTFLKKLNPDLVHFGIVQQPIRYNGKKITTMHDMTLLKTYNTDKNWFIYHAKQLVGRFVYKSIIQSNDHLIAISKFTKKEMLDFTPVPKEKISVIYEATDVASGSSRSYKMPFKKFILYVGNQSDYKNIKRLGDAHQRLLRRYPDLGLVLIGAKNQAALNNEAFFKKKNYTNILFTGFLPDEQLNWTYAHATAYVFPSLMEGFGLPALEAMGHGLPVVSSNATCLPEVYGDAAYYFDPKNVESMARAIDDVLSSDKIRRDLSVKGYAQVKKYSWKRMAEQTHAVYMKVLKAKN